MTRTYAMKRLLEHGPLTWCELLVITGWKRKAIESALIGLREAGLVEVQKASPRRNVYRLAA